MYCGTLVPESQAKGNLVAGKKETLALESCVKILNRAELVALSEAGVVLPRSCCHAAHPVEFVTVYSKLSSTLEMVVSPITELRPSAFGEPDAIALFAIVPPVIHCVPCK